MRNPPVKHSCKADSSHSFGMTICDHTCLFSMICWISALFGIVLFIHDAHCFTLIARQGAGFIDIALRTEA